MGVDQLQKSDFQFRVYVDKESLVSEATSWIHSRLASSLDNQESARIALSGGSTPKPVYAALSAIDLDWGRVEANLVDERLNADEAGSNAKMIDELLVQNKAADLKFIPVISEGSLVADIEYDICILGMGGDSHTASLFPDSIGLEEGLDPYNEKALVKVNAKGCPGAGNYPHRISMTLPAIMKSRHILLMMTGREKLNVFEAAQNKSVFDAPIKSILSAGDRLTVMWAP